MAEKDSQADEAVRTQSPASATLPMEDQTVERFIRTRDPELFRELVTEHQHRVFRLVASVLGPWTDRDA